MDTTPTATPVNVIYDSQIMLSVYQDHRQNIFHLFPQHSRYCRRFTAYKAWFFFPL